MCPAGCVMSQYNYHAHRSRGWNNVCDCDRIGGSVHCVSVKLPAQQWWKRRDRSRLQARLHPRRYTTRAMSRWPSTMCSISTSTSVLASVVVWVTRACRNGGAGACFRIWSIGWSISLRAAGRGTEAKVLEDVAWGGPVLSDSDLCVHKHCHLNKWIVRALHWLHAP